MGFAVRQDQHYTYADYQTWPDDFRCELIEGKVYAMSPAPTFTHQDLVGEFHYQIRAALGTGHCKVMLAPFDVRLPRSNQADDDTDSVVQPDLSIICDVKKLDEKGCKGAPDWVIEVLSPSTAGKDQVKKLRIYEQAGVREYWLVHPIDRVVTIYHALDGVYGRADVLEMEGQRASLVLPEVLVDFALMGANSQSAEG